MWKSNHYKFKVGKTMYFVFDIEGEYRLYKLERTNNLICEDRISYANGDYDMECATRLFYEKIKEKESEF